MGLARANAGITVAEAVGQLAHAGTGETDGLGNQLDLCGEPIA